MNSSQESLASLSQENLGLLSQETLAKALNALPKEILDSFMRHNFESNVSSMEDCDVEEDSLELYPKQMDTDMAPPVQMSNIECSYMQSSLPSIENIPGYYEFKVSTGIDNSSKKPKYVYSSKLQKLYVIRNSPCPFNFSANKRLDGFVIRAMLYFSSPENRTKAVERCYMHYDPDQKGGDQFYRHFIRSSSNAACYHDEENSKITSVTVNFENPEIGESSSTHLFYFKCYTSCSGGPNRRPICVVFTLERGKEVYGRCKMELKVCSDPQRDKETDESKYLKKSSIPSSPQSFDSIMHNESNALIQLKNKRRKTSDEKGFYIKAQDEEEYKFLRCTQKYYYMRKIMNSYQWTPTKDDTVKFLKLMSSNTESSEDL